MILTLKNWTIGLRSVFNCLLSFLSPHINHDEWIMCSDKEAQWQWVAVESCWRHYQGIYVAKKNKKVRYDD
jgi:hypothetical protein